MALVMRKNHVPQASHSAGGCNKWAFSLLLGNNREGFFPGWLSPSYIDARSRLYCKYGLRAAL